MLKINDLIVADVIWTDKELDRNVYNFACMETEMEPLLKANKNLCAVGIRRYNGEKCVHIGIRRAERRVFDENFGPKYTFRCLWEDQF